MNTEIVQKGNRALLIRKLNEGYYAERPLANGRLQQIRGTVGNYFKRDELKTGGWGEWTVAGPRLNKCGLYDWTLRKPVDFSDTPSILEDADEVPVPPVVEEVDEEIPTEVIEEIEEDYEPYDDDAEVESQIYTGKELLFELLNGSIMEQNYCQFRFRDGHLQCLKAGEWISNDLIPLATLCKQEMTLCLYPYTFREALKIMSSNSHLMMSAKCDHATRFYVEDGCLFSIDVTTGKPCGFKVESFDSYWRVWD